MEEVPEDAFLNKEDGAPTSAVPLIQPESIRQPGESQEDQERERNEFAADQREDKRRVFRDLTPDEKRNVYLDRNKAAASKCRQRKKQWINDTQAKADTLRRLTTDLQAQLLRLKAEQHMLVEYLTMHRNCSPDNIGVFLDNRHQWEQELLAIQGPEIPQFPTRPEGESESDQGESGEE